MLLKGKRLIVVGGAMGIGAETVRAYVEHGASVAALDLNEDEGRATVEEARKLGDGAVDFYQVDITDRDAVRRVTDEAVAKLGGLDGITITAGVEQQIPAEDLTQKDIDAVLGINVHGTMFSAAAAFPHLKENGGSVITYSSGSGVDGFPRMPTYSASKGAVLAYTRTIAQDWGQYGIRANSILPAVVTPMMAVFLEEMDPEQRKAMDETFASKIPLGG